MNLQLNLRATLAAVLVEHFERNPYTEPRYSLVGVASSYFFL